MIIKGRNLMQPTIVARYSTELKSFILRIDDSKILETWIEIEISEDELKSIKAASEAAFNVGEHRIELGFKLSNAVSCEKVSREQEKNEKDRSNPSESGDEGKNRSIDDGG